jgi:hypothetical protein
MQENRTMNVYDYWDEQRSTFAKLRLSMIKHEQKEKERLCKPTLSIQETINIILDKDGK